MKEKVKAIGNLLIAALVLTNAILTAAGKNPIPFDEDSIFATVSYILAAIDTVWIWWKNQNITLEAQTAQDFIKEMKGNRENPDGTGDPEGSDE